MLANRLHEELGLETLADLEAAAHDGRLATVAGFGPKRLAGIRDSLAHRLGRVRLPMVPGDTPSVSELLDVDREYREKAAAGELQRIAPRRFNPSGEAWLPILHTRRGARRYTALFSNTARAHRTGNARDWVVLYGDNGSGEHRHTVITPGMARSVDSVWSPDVKTNAARSTRVLLRARSRTPRAGGELRHMACSPR